MYALNEAGEPVSWWFAYKLPAEVFLCKSDPSTFKPSTSTRVGANDHDGYSYLYYQPGGKLALSAKSLAPNGSPGAITNTLQQIFGKATPPSIGWITYNDEEPEAVDLQSAHAKGAGFATNSSAWGHCKGILAFNIADHTGFWMIHSFPRWPITGQTTFPGADEHDRLKYAQTFICMSLGDLVTVENIAGMLRGYHEPQILDSCMPDGAASQLPTLAKLIRENTRSAQRGSPPANKNTTPGELTFQAISPGQPGATFRLFAKSAKWGKDFWTDLVAHRLGIPLDVETWRRVTKTDPIPNQADSDGHDSYDGYAVWIQDPGWYFSETEDHGKWAVGRPDASDLVCVGDINRQVSQEKRGGGTAVISDLALAQTLRSMIIVLQNEQTASQIFSDTGTLGGPDLTEGTAPSTNMSGESGAKP